MFAQPRKTIRVVFFGRKNNLHKAFVNFCAGYFSYQKKQYGLFFLGQKNNQPFF
jgi:hypothetical protein